MMAPSRGIPQATSSLWVSFLLFWWAGFKDACHFNRVYKLCRRSPTVRIKAGQCFLNGLLVLGSVLVLQKVLEPSLDWLLDDKESIAGRRVSKLLVASYYVFWLYPIYVISFVINCIRSNEIAQHVFNVLKISKSTSSASTSTSSSAIESFTLGIGEQLYSIIVIGVFFAEAFAASFIPYVGQFFYFLLLSWLYAYYCFEYKWGLSQWSLEKRLVFFETNWAFFSGFGSPCVFATFFFSPLVSTGVTAILYPLFVLIATASDPEPLVASVTRDSSAAPLPRLPIFYLSNNLTLPLLRLFHDKLPAFKRSS